MCTAIKVVFGLVDRFRRRGGRDRDRGGDEDGEREKVAVQFRSAFLGELGFGGLCRRTRYCLGHFDGEAGGE